MVYSISRSSYVLNAPRSDLNTLVNQGAWKEVPTQEATSKILPGTWTFHHKRTPNGEVKKYKGRYCVRGDLQEDKQSTYAPIVAWPSVCIFPVLSLVPSLHELVFPVQTFIFLLPSLMA